TYPQQDAAWLNFIPTISGTADGSYSGLQEVQVQISSQTGASWSVIGWYDTSNDITTAGVIITTWTITAPFPWGNWIDGVRYRIVSRARDNSGNYQLTLSTVEFIYDTTLPVVSITRPINNGYYGTNNTLPIISGTSQDPEPFAGAQISQIEKVELRISSGTGANTRYWDGNYWVATSSWLVATGTSPFTYTSPTWKDGIYFTVEARAYDYAKNLSLWTTNTFIWDETIPLSNITEPNTEYENEVTQITGNAQDPLGAGGNASGLAKVEVAISSGNLWYSWSDQTFSLTSSSWTKVSSGLTSWTHTWNIPSWDTNTLYVVYSSATDNSNNSQITISSFAFIFDTSRPTTVITKPPEGTTFQNSVPTISGTASDANPGRVQTVWLRIRRPDHPNSPYWDGNAWSDTDWVWIVAQSSVSNYVVWTSTFDMWTDGYRYEINARSVDIPGNYDITYSTSIFRYDTSKPLIAVTTPQNQTYIRGLTTISGTAVDYPEPIGVVNNSGIALRKVAIRRNSDGYWWGATGFESGWTEWSPTVSGDYWYFVGPSTANLTDGVSYYVTNKCQDNAGNLENWFNINGSTFVYDATLPRSTCTYPSAGALTALTQITGTSWDPVPAAGRLTAGVKEVYVALYDENRPSGSQYWAGSDTGWVESETYILSDGTDPWIFTDLPAWEQGHRYRIRSKARDWTRPSLDGIYNDESPVTERYFVFDSSAPIATLTQPLNGQSYRDLTAISGTARDYPLTPTLYNSGLQKVELQIRDESNNYTWTGSSWSPNSHLVSVAVSGTGEVSWGYAISDWTSGRNYNISARAYDTLNNYQAVISSVAFLFDNTPPVSFVQRPTEGTGYNSTTNILSTVSGTANDNATTPSNVEISIRVNNYPAEGLNRWWEWYGSSGAFAATAEVWRPATIYSVIGNTVSWRFTEISSTAWLSPYSYQIRTRATDGVQNPSANVESPIPTRNFSVDATPPTSDVEFPVNGGSYITIGIISGTAEDNPSGISKVEIKIWNETEGNKWWAGVANGWLTYSTWVTVTELTVYPTSATWRYTDIPANWPPSGKYYRLYSRAYDTAENPEVPDESVDYVRFSADNYPPQCLIQRPQNNTGYNDSTKPLNIISGTATEDFSGIREVRVRIQRLTDGYFWDGTAFASYADPEATTLWRVAYSTTEAGVLGPVNWQLPTPTEPLPDWESGKTYNVVVRGQDFSTNKSTFTVGQSSNTFTYDTDAPVAYFIKPLESATTPVYSSMATISGTAVDKPDAPLYSAGIKKVRLKIWYLYSVDQSTYYWTGSAWSSTTITKLPTTGTTDWTYTATQFQDGSAWSDKDGYLFFVEVHSQDNADNWSRRKLQPFIYDSVVPVTPVVNLPLNLRAYSNLPTIS
ncbi:MAG: hypothetical protein QME68_05130, partial [Elusimicrobiota bacterium]|nr:hypothetical protein [Elusimicrobiota bacterium]